MIGEGITTNLKGINSELKRTVEYLKEAKTLSSDIKKNTQGVGFGNGGTGNSGNSVMPGIGGVPAANGTAGSSMKGLGSYAAQFGLGLAKFGAAAATTGFNALPNTTQVITGATKYYNAALGQGVGRKLMASATFSAMQGGLTGIGSDAATAQQLAGMGIGFSSAQGSQYMRTLTGVSNAAKYMNMDNATAASAIGGLKSGSMSANLMRNFGIQTSDYRTGKTLTQGQIFEQLASRMQTGKQLTKENIMDSYQRGFLGENLRNSGLSEDQQGMFVQYLLAKAEGKNMDLEDPNAMAELMKGKDLNPAQAGYDINTSESKLQNKVADSYIAGQQKAVGYIEAFNSALEQTPPLILELKAGFDTLLGSNGTGNVIKGAADALTAFTETVLGLIGMLAAGGMLKGAGGLLGGKGGKGGKGGVPGAGTPAKGGKVKPGASPKAGGGLTVKGGAAAAGVIGGVQLATDVIQGNTDSATIGTDVGSLVGGVAGAALGGAALSFIPGVGTVLGATLGGMAGSWLGGMAGEWVGTTFFGGGDTRSSSGLGTSTSTNTNKSVSFKMPVSGPITSGFGPRAPINGSANFHDAIDIGAAEGTPIGASADGEVIFVGVWGTGGNTVKIKHANGYTSIYCHMSKTATSVGAQVKQGNCIGYVGSTGNSTGPHLHFAIQNASGQFIDPLSVINGTVSVSSTGTQDSAQQQKTSSDVLIGYATSTSSESLIDQRAKRAAGPLQGLRMGGGGAVNVLTNKPSATIGAGRSSKGTTKGMGSYDNDAPRAKEGDPYVAQDGPVNVHAGEAILTAEQASVWRDEQRGFGGRGRGANVTINLTVASASEAEARRFAKIVQSYLEEDGMVGRMGRN